MKSLSYIILLMSLIGNSQSGKAFCPQTQFKFCSEKAIENVSKTEARQLLKEFNRFLSKYHQKFQKQTVFENSNRNLSSKNERIINFEEKVLDEVTKLQQKTTKIRNKDNLDLMF